MKISIEKKQDPVIKSSVYSLSVGINKYHYEKLGDVLFRVATLFEPPQEEEKPKRKYAKRSEKFPLGDTILSILKGASKPMVVGDFMAIVPRKYTLSIWGAVLSKLVKRGKVKIVPLQDGKKSYKLA